MPTHVASVVEFASGPIATLVTSFDVQASRYRNIEVYGTEGTLSVPDPNTFGGPVRIKSNGDEEWNDVPLTHGTAQQSRGIGLADMVLGAAAPSAAPRVGRARAARARADGAFDSRGGDRRARQSPDDLRPDRSRCRPDYPTTHFDD